MLFSLMRRRKEEEAKAAQQAQRDQAFVSPPGHRRMADEERLSTLQALEEGNYSICERFNLFANLQKWRRATGMLN